MLTLSPLSNRLHPLNGFLAHRLILAYHHQALTTLSARFPRCFGCDES